MTEKTPPTEAAGLPSWAFRVPLPPCGKGRGRAVRVGQSVRVVTPAKTRTYEATVADLAHRAGIGHLEGPVRLQILAVFARPKWLAQVYKKTGLTKFPAGWLRAPVTPDADNVAQAIMDGMRAVWRDDKQVVRLEVGKVYAQMRQQPGGSWTQAPPCVVVRVSEYTAETVAFDEWPEWAAGVE